MASDIRWNRLRWREFFLRPLRLHSGVHLFRTKNRPPRLLADALRTHLSRLPLCLAAHFAILDNRRPEDARPIFRIRRKAFRADHRACTAPAAILGSGGGSLMERGQLESLRRSCLLYTSDAADEED